MECILISRQDTTSILDDIEDLQSGRNNCRSWQTDVPNSSWLDFFPSCSNNFSNEARVIREEYNDYFNNECALTY